MAQSLSNRIVPIAVWIILCALPMLLAGGRISEGAITHPLAARSVEPVSLVLQQRDVGRLYTRNASFSRPRTLKDAGSGDSSAIQRRLQDVWGGGYQVGFNGISVPWGIVSTVDVFRVARLKSIETAWTVDLLRFTGGRPRTPPSEAPGNRVTYTRAYFAIGTTPMMIDAYMWRRSRAIATITVTGKRNSFSSSLIFSLAKLQDARIQRAFS